MIYLDNAATSGKKPAAVINAVNTAMVKLSANPGRSGHSLSVNASELVYETRKSAARFFGSEMPEGVIFTQNCTQSINTVLKGVLSNGGHVVISDMEHNAVMRPLNKTGVPYTAAQVSFSDDDITLQNIKNAVRHNTEMIFVTAASNVFGKTLPLEKIGKFAKENGILFGVDAAQAAGVIPIDMKKYNIDYLCVAAHKGLYAPMGTGLLLARKDIKETIIEGGTGTESLLEKQPDQMPEKFESGTVNLPGIAGIRAGIGFISGRTEALYKTELICIQKMYEFLSKTSGVLLYTPYPEKDMYVPVLSFNIESLSSQTVGELLNKEGIAVRAGLHCAPCAHRKVGTVDTGTVRISPGYFNNLREITAVCETLKKICINRKKYIE